jgi:hypothetical protein
VGALVAIFFFGGGLHCGGSVGLEVECAFGVEAGVLRRVIGDDVSMFHDKGYLPFP